jgi:hypothetical protein
LIDFLRRALELDRRVLYAIVFLCVLLPLLFPVKVDFTPTTEVKRAYDDIEALQPGSAVVISCDYGPSTIPENYTFYEALLHQCFRKKLRPIIMTLVDYGPGLCQRGLREVLHSTDAQGALRYPDLVPGEDYVFLGFKPGSSSVMLGIGQSFIVTFPTDYSGNSTARMPLFREINALGDCSYIVDIAAVGMPEIWVPYASEREKVPLSVNCTAVSVAQYYPYYQAGQFRGLVGGMKGAAEYEKLVGMEEILGRTPDATKGMPAQNAVHIFIVLSIIVANVMFFLVHRDEQHQRRSPR